MLFEVCAYCRNFFVRPDEDIISGTFAVTENGISPADLLEGQHFRIVGSVFNDGVFRKGDSGFTPETFTGAVWKMRIPKDFLQLVEEIEAWQEKYGDASASPYSSESFAGQYSYQKGGSSSGGSSTPTSWKEAFNSRLNVYKRVNVL